MSSAKVAYLFLRTMAKPVANAVKNYAKTHPKFTERTIAMAQGVHRIETNLKRSLLDYQVDHVRPLTDARALEMGANFIGEATLFFLVAGVVVLETTRQAVSPKRRR
ncbi:optic atrophy 3-like protein, partial [Catenaria anguillulae PL171]